MANDVNGLLKHVIEQVREEAFVQDYKAKATDEECLGIALSWFFGWSGEPILKVCYSGLEDANYHTINQVIEALIEADEPDSLANRMVTCKEEK